jgi:hypothetical protein
MSAAEFRKIFELPFRKGQKVVLIFFFLNVEFIALINTNKQHTLWGYRIVPL